ncbi:hypothetical protein NHF50_07995 [Flavobacterium sp. NRK F10]|uniref:hypothetical protein n=1 Tax=Flavobacterium sp. NRK F10 TaxID=2954931 RepID=UPI002090992C|nr:hypothetical protein [Flavobacterium sp. NRK F10]MCO6174987.1 hypothetical protein [Flavobacterium sp. NRK F10]
MERLILYTLILFLCFFQSCDNNKEENNISLLEKIIESNLIKENRGEYFYIDKRSNNIFVYEDIEGEKILFDLKKHTLISVLKNGQEIYLSEERKEKIMDVISDTKRIMDSLKIYSIYPDEKKFIIETIIIDSESEENNFLGLISFDNTTLSDSLVERYKKEFDLIKLDSINSWYYYKYKK